MKRYAMTGAGGRLAGALRDALPRAPNDWILVSRNCGGGFINYRQLEDHYRNGLDALVHLAWSSVPATAERDPSRAWTDDFPLIARLLGSGLIKRGGQFVFFSSGGAVYGDTTGTLVDENHPLKPATQYGSAKVFAERLVLQLCRKHDIRPVIFRLTNPYGLRCETGIPQGAIGFALQAALHDRTFEIWGNGHTTKDYIHVRDVASALDHALRKQIEGTYNIANGKSHSLLDLLKRIETISGRCIRTTFLPANSWDVGTGSVETRKMQHLCGWKALIDIDGGLAMEWDQLSKPDSKNISR